MTVVIAAVVVAFIPTFIHLYNEHKAHGTAEAHTKVIETAFEFESAVTEAEASEFNAATCDNFLAANPKISACSAELDTEFAASKRRRRLPEATCSITLYFEAGNEVSTADLGALVEGAITEAAAEVMPDNAVTGITYTVGEATEVDENDIPECANVSEGCGPSNCAGGEYWNGSECTDCPEYTYTETGVYATASGDSDSTGCIQCPVDAAVKEWFSTDDPSGTYLGLGEDGAGLITWTEVYKYSPAGSEGENSCKINCLYGQYWDGSGCTDCPVDTYYGPWILDLKRSAEEGGAPYYDSEDPAKPAYMAGDPNPEICVSCEDIPVPDEPGGTWSTLEVVGMPYCTFGSDD